MSVHLQPGSMSMDFVVQREIEERIRRAREQEMVRAAKGPRTKGFAVVGIRPARLLNAVRVALVAPVASRARQAFGS